VLSTCQASPSGANPALVLARLARATARQGVKVTSAVRKLLRVGLHHPARMIRTASRGREAPAARTLSSACSIDYLVLRKRGTPYSTEVQQRPMQPPANVEGTRRSFLTAPRKRSPGPTLERRRPRRTSGPDGEGCAANLLTQPPRLPNWPFKSSKETPCWMPHASSCVTSTGSDRVRDASSARSDQPARRSRSTTCCLLTCSGPMTITNLRLGLTSP